MPYAPYRGFTNIKVNQAQPYLGDVTRLLDAINSTGPGRTLLTEINMCAKEVAIAPLRPIDSGNKCVSAHGGRFVRLRQAFLGTGSLREELTWTLDKAELAGVTRQAVAKLAAGTAAPSERTAQNIGRDVSSAPSKGQFADTFDLVFQLANGKVGANAATVSAGAGQYTLADRLIRALKPWLRAGDGANCQVYFDPAIMRSCGNDGRPTTRPPAIGLAHELCHAWRNVKGMRLFDDALSCGLNDDEVMTTGIPPYQYEKFSENLFRSVWADAGLSKKPLEMRENYR